MSYPSHDTRPGPIQVPPARQPTGKRRKPLFGVLGLLALAVVGLGACGDDDDDTLGTQADDLESDLNDAEGEGPEGSDARAGDADAQPFVEVLDAFAAGWNSGDCAAALDVASTDFIAESGGYDAAVADCETNNAAGMQLNIEGVTVTSQSDSAATVEATFSNDGVQDVQTVNFVVEDGSWKMDSYT